MRPTTGTTTHNTTKRVREERKSERERERELENKREEKEKVRGLRDVATLGRKRESWEREALGKKIVF